MRLWWRSGGTTQLGLELGPHGFVLLPFATWLRQQERLRLEEKGEKGLLLVGHEKVPHGSGLTGDCGGDTAAVLEPRGCPNHRLLLLFLRYGTRDWAKGRRKDCVCL